MASHQDAGLYYTCSDVDAAFEYLRAKGVSVSAPKARYYGAKELVVTDPDGFSLHFQQFN